MNANEKRWRDLEQQVQQNQGASRGDIETRGATALHGIAAMYRSCSTVADYREVTTGLAGQSVSLARAIADPQASLSKTGGAAG